MGKMAGVPGQSRGAWVTQRVTGLPGRDMEHRWRDPACHAAIHRHIQDTSGRFLQRRGTRLMMPSRRRLADRLQSQGEHAELEQP